MSLKNQTNTRDFISRSYIRDNKVKFFTIALDVLFGIALLGLCLFLMSMAAYAQNVGINNAAPHAKSLLDLTSSDKGLLTPRMTEAQRNAMFVINDVTAKGMLVYQTDNTQGFYYYDGTAWNIISTSSNDWSAIGNSGTNPNTNFIGTTDAKDFVMKTNNTENLRITSTGNIGIGTAAPSAKLHIKSNSVTGTQNIKITEYSNDYTRIGMYNDSSSKFWEISSLPHNVDSLAKWHVFNSNTGNLLTVLGNGRVGISNSNPIAPLSFNNGLGQKITFWGTASNSYGIGLQSALLQVHTAGTNDDIAFGTGSSANLNENVRFKGNGKVGIGTKTPAAQYPYARVEIADDDGFNSDLLMSVGHGAKGYSQIIFHKSRGTVAVPTTAQNGDITGVIIGRVHNGAGFENASAILLGIDSAVSAGNVRSNIIFQTSGGTSGEKMRITKDGFIGISNNVPVAPVSFNNNHGQKITFWNSGASSYGIGLQSSLLQIHVAAANNDITFGYGSSTAFTERMRIKGNGDVGIGTATPSARLHVYSNSVTGTQNIKAHESGNDFARIGLYNDSTTKFWEIAAQPNIVDSLARFNVFNSSSGNLLTVTGDGNMGIKSANPTAELEVNGFTKLGLDAPSIKMKKFTGTTSSLIGGTINILHGLSSSKILNVSLVIEYSAGNYVTMGYNYAAGFEASIYYTSTHVIIGNVIGNSGNILSKPFKIVITYEE